MKSSKSLGELKRGELNDTVSECLRDASRRVRSNFTISELMLDIIEDRSPDIFLQDLDTSLMTMELSAEEPLFDMPVSGLREGCMETNDKFHFALIVQLNN